MNRRIDIQRLPSNNKSSPNRPTQIETTGRITTGHASRGSGLANTIRDIGNSLFDEIVLPTLKNAIVDFFSSGITMAMFGDDRRDVRGGRPRAYNRQYTRRQEPIRRARPLTRRDSRYSRPTREVTEVFEDVFFQDRKDAELVLGRLMERIADYGVASVGDLYSLVGLSTNYTHERYGWVDLSGVGIQFTTEGYIIGLPEVIYLD